MVDIYSTKLKQEGFELSLANDGAKAMKALEQTNPDLVLLDIVLPSQDGWEVLKKIKSREHSPKVIILSNLGQKEEVEKGLKLGAEAYLIKANFTPSEVIQEIKKLI